MTHYTMSTTYGNRVRAERNRAIERCRKAAQVRQPSRVHTWTILAVAIIIGFAAGAIAGEWQAWQSFDITGYMWTDTILEALQTQCATEINS